MKKGNIVASRSVLFCEHGTPGLQNQFPQKGYAYVRDPLRVNGNAVDDRHIHIYIQRTNKVRNTMDYGGNHA